MSDEFKKEIKIINSYGAVLEKYAGYAVINEKHLPNKKSDIKKAIKLIIAQSILANQKYDQLIAGYMQLGQFQKYQNVSNEDLLDPDPIKYLKKSEKHKKMIDKSNKESDTLYSEINQLAEVMTEKVKSK